MLFSAEQLRGNKVAARDGDIGSVKDLYFDDQDWAVRYLVLDTGGWLSGRNVLIAPHAAAMPSLEEKRLPVLLTKTQIENSPAVETALPVSREQELRMTQYYGWPSWWAMSPPPGEMMPVSGYVPAGGQAMQLEPEAAQESQLRSAKEVTGYVIQAADGQIGHVEDFLVESESWKVRYMVVDTRTLLPGKKVLVAPLWIDRISWADRSVRVDVSKDLIRTAPEYDRNVGVGRDYERALFSHYSRVGYW